MVVVMELVVAVVGLVGVVVVIEEVVVTGLVLPEVAALELLGLEGL